MTLVLDLKPETEATLRAVAARRGMALPALLDDLAANLKSEHLSGARSSKVLRGMLKGSSPTVDELISERHQEASQDIV